MAFFLSGLTKRKASHLGGSLLRTYAIAGLIISLVLFHSPLVAAA